MPRKASAGSAGLMPSMKLLDLLPREEQGPGSQVGPIKPGDEAVPSHHPSPPQQCPPKNGVGEKTPRAGEDGGTDGDAGGREGGEQRGAGQTLLRG